MSKDALPMKMVTVPAKDHHEGFHSMTVFLPWVCPECGGPRGEVFPARSYDGSRILFCDGWRNPCGHVDKYDMVREEWQAISAGVTYERAKRGV